MADYSELINKILEIELEMFVNVPSLRPAACQENAGGFKLVRGSGFGEG